MAEKPKTLTMKLDLDTLAEFAVAAQIFRARSVSSFVHEYVVRQINEAKKLIDPAVFSEMVERQKDEIRERSEQKKLAALRPVRYTDEEIEVSRAKDHGELDEERVHSRPKRKAK